MELMQNLWFLLVAQAGDGAAQPGGSPFLQLLPLFAVLFVFYFLLIRPGRQRQKLHRELLEDLKNGDKVVTQGGIRGTVAGVTDDMVLIRVTDNVKIEFSKSAVVALMGDHPES